VATLALSLLGPFAAALDGRSLTSFRTKATQALLIYLACQPEQAHRRERLMALLWPGLPQKSAQANLRQTLYQLRRSIPAAAAKDGGDPVTFLLSDWQTIRVNPEASYELDVREFQAKLGPALEGWPEAVALYRGDFLADFYLPDSEAFEEWVLSWRADLRGRALKALDSLAGRALEEGDYEAAEGFARRSIEIDYLRESSHRQYMQALAGGGRRNEALAHYEHYQQLVRRELDATPSPEMVLLQQAILAGQGEKAPAPKAQPPFNATDLLPAVLASSFPIQAPDRPRPIFAGRRAEIDRLNGFLESVLRGQGQVAFVAGDAGSGKSSLLQAFAAQAGERYDGLLVAWGSCNAFSGRGDPYLPFRDILNTLTGEVETPWAAGAITTGQARTLWENMPASIDALLDRAPDLLGTFVPRLPLLARGSRALPGDSPLLRRLNDQAGKAPLLPGELEQVQLFEQLTAMLRELAAARPMVLLVDDFQWADSGSISLFFHLGRRLAESRIFLIGAYRPDELGTGPGMVEGRHPLRQLLDEFQRLYGDVQLDLNQAQGREFVDAYLDSHFEQFDERFRTILFDRTGGHPLFMVEIVRDLQERGDLFQDEAGGWRANPALELENLPARVEGVIGARIGRLEDDLRELLALAAVEGEAFTVQVLARTLGKDERGLLRTLSRDLERQHRLVREQAAVKVGQHNLFRYRFAHALFQQYLYDDLGVAERQLLHGDVAAALEAIYAGRTDEIAVELAHHYVAAGAGEKALPHLLIAGDEARRLYAFADATRHYERALDVLQEQGDYEGAARILMKLGLTYHSAADYERARQAYERGFALGQRISLLPSPGQLPPAPHALRIMDTVIPATLDPTRTEEGELIAYLFSGLVQITRELDVMPDVAARWEVFDAGRVYVFHLRDDVFWSDGAPVTAGDFVFAWRRALDPIRGSSASHILFDVKGAVALNQSREPDAVQLGVTALDPLTLRIELEQPTTYFLYVVTHGATAPVPVHAVKALGEGWAEPENIITNGPFRLESWTKGRSLSFGRNPTYHGRFRGNVDRVELLPMRDAATALEHYGHNDLDILNVWPFSPADFRRATQQYAGEFLNWPANVTGFVGFNVRRPPFDDPRVRRAFVLACDRQALADVHEMGRAFPATGGFVPPGLPGHVPDIALPYDLQQGRQLLAEAGFPDGRGLPTITAILPPWDEVRVPEYALKPWESGLGAVFSWRVVDWAEYHAAVEAEKPHLIAYGWGGFYPDPDVFLRGGVQQIGKWRDQTYFHLVEQARHIVNQTERMSLYRQAEEILVEQVPFMPVLYVRHNFLVKPWVRNYQPSLIENAEWQDVMIEPH
jgi:ABC-type transport system substrate-binding protein/DNA-binding SARP family transcriptional activator